MKPGGWAVKDLRGKQAPWGICPNVVHLKLGERRVDGGVGGAFVGQRGARGGGKREPCGVGLPSRAVGNLGCDWAGERSKQIQ
jgi:hypothetical protein